MPNIFTTGPIADEERRQQQSPQPLYSPLSPQSPTRTLLPGSPVKPTASHDSLYDYVEGRRPYRRTQTTRQTLKRWCIGPPILLLCIALVVGLAWLVFSRVYQQNPFFKPPTP